MYIVSGNVWGMSIQRGIEAELETKVKTLDSKDKHGQKNLEKGIKLQEI